MLSAFYLKMILDVLHYLSLANYCCSWNISSPYFHSFLLTLYRIIIILLRNVKKSPWSPLLPGWLSLNICSLFMDSQHYLGNPLARDNSKLLGKNMSGFHMKSLVIVPGWIFLDSDGLDGTRMLSPRGLPLPEFWEPSLWCSYSRHQHLPLNCANSVILIWWIIILN